MLENIVSKIGRFSYNNRKLIALLGAIILVFTVIFQSMTVIEYTYAEDSIVTDIFPQDDTLVIVYNNYDEKSIPSIIEKLEKDEHVTSVQAYANTLGMRLSPDELAQMLGIDIVFLNTLFYIYENGMLTEGMTFIDFVTFISSDSFLENEMFESMIDEDSKSQIKQLGDIVFALTDKKAYTPEEIASQFGVDVQTVKIIFYIKQFQNISSANATSTIFGTLANALGMKTDILEELFDFEPVKKMTFADFADTITSIYPFISSILDKDQSAQLQMLVSISQTVKNNEELFPEDIAEMFSTMDSSGMLNEDTITLLYILSRSNTMDFSNKRIAIYDFFVFITEKIVSNESLSSFFDDETLEQIEAAESQIVDGKAQLVGRDHSRMVVTLNYVPESKEIYDFYDDLTKTLDSCMVRDYYLVGNSAMGYEVSVTFDKEFLIITIVTALVILLVVIFTFKNVPVSLLLICVIECAVFAMMSTMTVTGSPIFFIALILVQCILMGTMIDYAILFTSYYKEVRKTHSIEDALPETMKRSAYAILTSSLILVLVTFFCGLFMEGTVAAILQALSIGAFCAILLIMFVLPSLLVLFDKWVIKEKQ